MGVFLSLRSRLFIFFVAIVVIPLAAASFLARGVTIRELERRSSNQLQIGGVASGAIYQGRANTNAPSQVRNLVDEEFLRLLAAKDTAGLQAYIDARLPQILPSEPENSIDYVVIADPGGAILARSFSPADYLPRTTLPTAEEILSGGPGSRLVTRAEIPIRAPDSEDVVAVVHGGYYLDNQFVAAISERIEVEETFFVKERAISSTIQAVRDSKEAVVMILTRRESFFPATVGGEDIYASPVQLDDSIPLSEVALVVSTPQAPILDLARTMTITVLIFLAVATLAAVALGSILTRGITRPIAELAAGADAIAGGNYQQNIAVRSRDEVGKLATAFNEMADSLQSHVAQLNESRDELKRALTRFGETLRSTHDLEQLLNVIVDTSMDHLQADRGLLMLLTPNRDKLVVRVHRGIDDPNFELKTGQGLAGHVLETGTAIRLPDDSSDLDRALREPEFRTALVVPIFAEERAVGVLCLYDKQGEENFGQVDLASLLSLADQAGVAIENVFLHDQARTHAIVDTVVGTWNRRYFQQRMEQELERHARFEREFSLLMIDIDDFKHVNDTFGHQRGDGVLIELVARVTSVIREIDVFARWGGEEFILLLPETDPPGGLRTAERIREAVAERPFEGNPPVKITVSVGVAGYPVHGDRQESLTNAADTAMYKAKAEGKNRAVLYESPI